MRAKRVWTIESLLTCFLWNAVMVVFFYFIARQILQGFQQWVGPFVAPGTTGLPDDVAAAFANLSRFLSEANHYLPIVVFGAGGVVTLLLWLTLFFEGRGLVNRAHREAGALPTPLSEAIERPREPARPSRKERQPPAAAPAPPSPQPAVQILSILQRDGRLIDFLQEDLSLYEDAQIGAAVRNIHQGCKQALSEYVDLKPIYEEAEGDAVTVASGFDSRAVRLTGAVTGDPPFRGILRHRGWKVARMELPVVTTEQKKDWILAPAEVEVEG